MRCRNAMLLNYLFDEYKELEVYFSKFAENELMLPVLAESINAQLGKGILVKRFPFWRRNVPVVFDKEDNKIYINYRQLDFLTPLLKSLNPLQKEKKRYKSIEEDEFAHILSGLFYHGIHAYNLRNKGVLIKNELNLTWYKKFFYMNIYTYGTNPIATTDRDRGDNATANFFSGRLNTLVAKQVSDLIYRPFMQIILQYYEAYAYNNAKFTSDQEKRLDFMFTQLNQQITTQLEEWNYSQPDLDFFHGWLRSFMREFKICFRNNDTIILNQDQDIINIQEFNCLNLRSIQTAYYHMKPYMVSNVEEPNDGLRHRYPAPPFRELYSIAEPLAQTLAVGAYEIKKLRTAEDLQTLCARGLATLS